MAVLPTHKYRLSYLEHCRIVMSDERLCYVRRDDAVEKTFSLPYANSNVLLLGPGTSLTHQAARLLSEEGVMLAFVGGGATPLYFASCSEYRPTEYLQSWVAFWFNPSQRLAVAKYFQRLRLKLIEQHLAAHLDAEVLQRLVDAYAKGVTSALDNSALLINEAHFSKALYAELSKKYRIEKFARTPRGGDPLNDFLDAGNYMAYGLSACALWILGIPHSLAVNHGMTRRGALVFDVADIVKDALIMPQAFKGFAEGDTPSKNRHRMVLALEQAQALKTMLEALVQAPKEAIT